MEIQQSGIRFTDHDGNHLIIQFSSEDDDVIEVCMPNNEFWFSAINDDIHAFVEALVDMFPRRKRTK